MFLAVTSSSEADILDARAPASAASGVEAWKMGLEHLKTLGWVWAEKDECDPVLKTEGKNTGSSWSCSPLPPCTAELGQAFTREDVVTRVSVPNLGLTLKGVMTLCVFAAWFSPECQTCRVAAVWGGQAFHLHSSCHPFDMQSRPHGGVLPPVPGCSGPRPSFSPGCGPAMSQERLEMVAQLH